DIVSQEEPEANEAEWERIFHVFLQAFDTFDEFRKEEGAVLKRDMELRTKLIVELLTEIEGLEPNRIPRIRERIATALKDWGGKDLADANRLEQELIYHIDKLDITEEKIRLKSHCDY